MWRRQLSDQAGELIFYRGQNTSETGSIYQSGNLPQAVKVTGTTIDSLVNELRLKTVDLIEMDIEGAERLALKGAKETLRTFQPRLIICLYHRLDDMVQLPKAVIAQQPAYHIAHKNLTQAFFW